MRTTSPRPTRASSACGPGDRLTVADLLRGLMLESANDAAETLGEYVGGSASDSCG